MNERDDQGPHPGEPREDAVIEQALRALEEGRGPAVPAGRLGGLNEEEETLLRLYTELLGLLPAELAPAAPPAQLKRRLLVRVAGGEAEPQEEESAIAAPAGEDAEARGGTVAPIAPVRAEARPASRGWALPLAAALAALMLGVSGWLFFRLEEQKAELVRLQRGVEATAERAERLADTRAALARMEQALGLVTAPAVEICPLRPVGEQPVLPGARGVLYVAADHQHWYLALHGMEPCPEGRVYQLWFVARGVPVSAGTFDAPRPGERIELSSETMPAGTEAVLVTLEPGGGTPQPSGPEVLYGDEVMRVL